MGTCYSAMSVWTYLGKRWNDAYRTLGSSCGKTQVSYQGIALATAEAFEIRRPFRDWAWDIDFFRNLLGARRETSIAGLGA